MEILSLIFLCVFAFPNGYSLENHGPIMRNPGVDGKARNEPFKLPFPYDRIQLINTIENVNQPKLRQVLTLKAVQAEIAALNRLKKLAQKYVARQRTKRSITHQLAGRSDDSKLIELAKNSDSAVEPSIGAKQLKSRSRKSITITHDSPIVFGRKDILQVFELLKGIDLKMVISHLDLVEMCRIFDEWLAEHFGQSLVDMLAKTVKGEISVPDMVTKLEDPKAVSPEGGAWVEQNWGMELWGKFLETARAAFANDEAKVKELVASLDPAKVGEPIVPLIGQLIEKYIPKIYGEVGVEYAKMIDWNKFSIQPVLDLVNKDKSALDPVKEMFTEELVEGILLVMKVVDYSVWGPPFVKMFEKLHPRDLVPIIKDIKFTLSWEEPLHQQNEKDMQDLQRGREQKISARKANIRLSKH